MEEENGNEVFLVSGFFFCDLLVSKGSRLQGNEKQFKMDITCFETCLCEVFVCTLFGFFSRGLGITKQGFLAYSNLHQFLLLENR